VLPILSATRSWVSSQPAREGTMPKKGQEEPQEPSQETLQGHTIPVPTREQVFRDLQKVAKPSSKARRRRRPEK
jgi:hypothetical protein